MLTLEEIEKEIEEFDHGKYWKDRIMWLISRVKELEAQQQGIGQMINRAHARIEQLEEGIRKHKRLNVAYNPGLEKYCSIASTLDNDLYKLLEK